MGILNLKLKKDYRLFWFSFLFAIILLNSFPIARAIGAIYQSARGNATVRVSFIKKNEKKNKILS